MAATPSMHDAIIVGGGPGGLHVAARLAASGHHVSVLEEHDAFGDPVHCTGILADEVFAEFNLPRAAVLNPLPAARFHSPSGLDVSYSPATPEAMVIDRRVFDRTLAAAATGAGAELMRGVRVTSIDVHEDSVEVSVDGGNPLRARAVVLACGANYSFQRKLGMGMPTLYLSSAQMELPAARDGEVELYFGAEVAPRGFAWAVPVRRSSGPHVRIGLMSDGESADHFRRLVDRIGVSWGVSIPSDAAPRRRLLPLGAIRKTYADRVLAVGDAAGLVKPTTGGGIYYSLVSADIAADVLDEGLKSDTLESRALGTYEKRWRKRLMPEFRSQLALRMLIQRLSDREIDDLFELARTDGIMPIVKRTARFNRHRDLIVALFKHPPARRVLFRRLVG
jgi:digeranylgeranylglycerophospholipid reductase